MGAVGFEVGVMCMGVGRMGGLGGCGGLVGRCGGVGLREVWGFGVWGLWGGGVVVGEVWELGWSDAGFRVGSWGVGEGAGIGVGRMWVWGGRDGRVGVGEVEGFGLGGRCSMGWGGLGWERCGFGVGAVGLGVGLGWGWQWGVLGRGGGFLRPIAED